MKFRQRVRKVRKHPVGSLFWKEIITEDYFFHTVAQITVVRVCTLFFHPEWKIGQGRKTNQWVHWNCPELGGGTAGLAEWVKEGKQRPHHDKTRCDCQN